MINVFQIAGYCRISVDEELDRDNTSIENQKSIIADFVHQRFPDSVLSFYEDRDRSGYTFEQRENYQAMRRKLVSHELDILVVKDFSRFSRRNSRGLVELEDLRDAGVRIISIGDGIDFPNDDDWLKIQFQFLINEMPVTDASKKVKSVIRRRQADGKWICAAPYGYIVNKRQEFEPVPTEADIIRRVFSLYLEGWGYKRIANLLTDEGIPTPRMNERDRKEAAGEDFRRTVRSVWSVATVQGILDNDFYIGTLRQGKYTRRKINGKDMKCDEGQHIVIEKHHQSIVDYRTFAAARALREQRTTDHYRGVKKYDNVYSGFLECGDCGSPMFSMSRADRAEAYRCGSYHRRGKKACTSHYIRADKLDELLKLYLCRVRDNSSEMMERLSADLAHQDSDMAEAERSSVNLEAVLSDLQEELKATKRQRIRDIMKHPEREEMLDETYDELESDLMRRIHGLQTQIEQNADHRNTILRVNRAAKTVLEIFDDILSKDKLDANDLRLIIEKIRIYEDRVEVQLKADVDSLLRCGTMQTDIGATLVQPMKQSRDKVYCVNIVYEGDPLEIFTSKDGEVIFKKYSLLGGVDEFAAQLCETLSKSTGNTVAVTDRDSVIAAAGSARRDLIGKHISSQLEQIMEDRGIYRAAPGERSVFVTESLDRFCASVAAPIISEGDALGLVLFVSGEGEPPAGDTEYKMAQAIANFLGRHMES